MYVKGAPETGVTVQNDIAKAINENTQKSMQEAVRNKRRYCCCATYDNIEQALVVHNVFTSRNLYCQIP